MTPFRANNQINSENQIVGSGRHPMCLFQSFHSFEWGAEYFRQVRAHLLTNNENRIARLLPDVFHIFFLLFSFFNLLFYLFHYYSTSRFLKINIQSFSKVFP